MGVLFVVVLFVLAGVLAVIYYRSQVKGEKLAQERKDRGEVVASSAAKRVVLLLIAAVGFALAAFLFSGR